ncbi:hypothetical protein [Aureimonas sp. Leaf324]|jgi:hypothetical protein|uniref:hypothetical protein n=1 Tax=Aureimonas sp. Leaf324 TaxID=1736336 RepID=UPI000AC02F64|nr:hypothetical protein [Aureimonas sp. Leaf324]
MSTTDIIEAYEAGLITRNEAIEQGLVDDLNQLYKRDAQPGGWSPGNRQAAARAHAGR